jgi:hypothetical protein
MKTRFLLRFLLVFAILVPAGARTGFPRLYARSLEIAAAAVGPALNGWSFESHPQSPPSGLRFRRGSESLPLQLSLEALALGLVPLLSLIGATPGMSARRRGRAILLGVAGLFALDLLVLLAYPWMVRNPNAIKDITGTYLGLLTFVGGPVILWFVLTYESLEPIWHLPPQSD